MKKLHYAGGGRMDILIRVIRDSRRVNILWMLLCVILIVLELLSYPLLCYAILEGCDSRFIVFMLVMYMLLPRVITALEAFLTALGNDNRMERIKESFGACLHMDYEFLESDEGQQLFLKAVNTTNSSSAPFSVFYIQLIKSFSSSIFLVMAAASGFMPGMASFPVTAAAALVIVVIYIVVEDRRRLHRSVYRDAEVPINGNIRYLNKITRMKDSSETLSWYKAQNLLYSKFMDEESRLETAAGRYEKRMLHLRIAEYLPLSVIFLVGLGSGSVSFTLFPLLWQISKASEIFAMNVADLKVTCLQLKDFYRFIDRSKQVSNLNIQETVESIEFRSVSFSYESRPEKKVLDNVSFRIGKGERLALMGLNGAGKTTIVKMLLGFYRPDSGSVLVNGIDVSSIGNIRNLFGTVFQDDTVIPASIRDNILMGRDYDEERYCEVLDESGLKDVLNRKGIDDSVMIPAYYCMNGTDMSNGEMQALYLARILYKNASFFIMDEPSASLDPMAEYELFSHCCDIMGDRGGIFISHRCSSLSDFDRILVIDNGRVAEEGPFSELIEKGGIYADVYRKQAELLAGQSNA